MGWELQKRVTPATCAQYPVHNIILIQDHFITILVTKRKFEDTADHVLVFGVHHKRFDDVNPIANVDHNTIFRNRRLIHDLETI